MNNFLVWVDQAGVEAGGVQSYSDFSADTQRSQGFKAGNPASSIRVNTALRQANLVAAAFMNVISPNSTLNFRSTLDATISEINTKLKAFKVNNASNADNATEATTANITNLDTNSNAIVKLQIGTGTVYTKTINNVANATNAGTATNVSTNINGKAISTIFESNGTTVKNATKWSGYSIWIGTLSAYDAITSKDANTLYFIKES